jgi:hypothetical protein
MDYSGNGDVTGELVATNDIVIPPGAEASTSNSGCEPTDFVDVTTVTAPRIALIQRGTCDFVVKAENAENAGYDAVIIFTRGRRAVRRRCSALSAPTPTWTSRSLAPASRSDPSSTPS